MGHLSDMYEEHLQPMADLQALANNGVLHSAKDLKNLKRMLYEHEHSADITTYLGLAVHTREEEMVSEGLRTHGKYPYDVKSFLYNSVKNELDMCESPRNSHHLAVFKIMYGDIQYALTLMEGFPVFCKWRLEIG